MLPLIDPAVKQVFLPKEFDDYPVLKYNEQGFPSVSKYPSRVEISAFFHPGYRNKSDLDLTKFAEYNWLVESFRSTPAWADYYRLPNKDVADDNAFEYWSKAFVESFIERYYYLYGTRFSEKKLEKIFTPAAHYLNSETLHFDIAVPILFTKFQPDQFKITDQIYIRKITDENQRARHRIKAYSPAILDSVYMSATHELVLKDYSYHRQKSFYNSFHFSDPLLYPVDQFETFFTILKLVTDHTSGDAQILLYPANWSEYYTAT